MANPELIERLQRHRALSGVPREELEWLVEHGEIRRFQAGDQLILKGEAVENMWIILVGRMGIDVDQGGGPRRVIEWHAGDITGLLPYSRLTATPGGSLAEEPTEVLAVHRSQFPEMLRACPRVVEITVHVMLDRARVFNSSALHDEKMMSMGKLAAGLAHELNNPASAALRGAKLLISGLTELEHASNELGAAGLDAREIGIAQRARELCLAPTDAVLSPLEQVDREDQIAVWLDASGADAELAPALAETGVSLDTLREVAAGVRAEKLNATLRWIAAGCSIRALARDVQGASARIHDLVSAVKRFTYMDRARAVESVDVEHGLRDTVTVVASKARNKGASVTLDVEPGLPPVGASGAELNQVWLNLLDNALDGVPEGGRIEISARCEHRWVLVRIVDNGPGVPPEIRQRIFDAFYTTKQPGQGTGLGLDIARRLVRGSGGDIELESEPGRTEFRVRLPARETSG